MALAAAGRGAPRRETRSVALDLETRRTIGVMLGSGGGAVEFSERMYELWFKGNVGTQASIYSIPSGTIGTIASEISMAYDLHGFSHLISTGCTSSTDAIGYAYRNLKLGVIDYVICGGADATITEAVMTGFCIMRIVSNGDQRDAGSGVAALLQGSRRLRARGRRVDVRHGARRERPGARCTGSMPKWPDTARRATPTTASAWTNRAKSRRAPWDWR